MANQTSSASAAFNRRLLIGLAVAVALWGFYLAIGATIFNSDPRKGLIILSCTFAFLALWALVVFRQPGGDRQSADRKNANLFSVFSLAIAVPAALIMLIAASGISAAIFSQYPIVLLLAFLAALLAAVVAVIGLSDPRRPRHRWMGLLALAASGLSLVVGCFIPTV